MKGKMVGLLFIILGLVVGWTALAQSNTGSISGKVVDQKGNPIPGATVVVSSPALQGTKGTATGKDGNFLIPYLPPSSDYTVTVSAEGFNKVVLSKVQVQLNSTTNQNISLESGKSVVTVTAHPPAVSLKDTKVSTNLTSQELSLLPLGRGYQNTLFLAPTAINAGAGGNPGVAGSTADENVWIINGINTTDVVTGTFGTNLNYNFVREVEVNTGGLPAEYSSSTGGLFNVLTKSGSNEFHGEAFAYYTNQNFSAKGIPVGAGGLTQTGFHNYDYGFDLGGPIVKDKLWYYVGYNPTLNDTHYQGAFNETNLVYGNKLTIPYNWDDLRKSWNWSAKINYRLSDHHSFELAAFGDPYSAWLPDVDGNYPTINDLSRLTRRYQGGYNWIARWYASWNSNFYSETSFGRNKNILQAVPFDNAGWGYPALVSLDWSPSLSVGAGMGLIDSDTRTSSQFENKETLTLGNHEIKFGGTIRWMHYYGFLGYSGNSYNLLMYGPASGNPSSNPNAYYYDIRYSLQNPLGDSTGKYYAAFAQDNWSITNYVNLNYGLRWEENRQTPTGADGFSVNSLSPRISLSWDFMHNGKSKLYLDYGEYTEQVPIQIANNMAPGHAFYEDILNYGTPVAHYVSSQIPFKVYGSPKDQYTKEWLGGIEYEVSPDFTIGARLQYRELARALDTYGYLDNQGNLNFFIVNPGGPYEGMYLNNWINARDYNGNLFNQYSPFSKPVRKYKALTLTAKKRFSNHWFLNSSLTFSRLEGNYTGAAYGYGTTAFDYGPNQTGFYLAPFQVLQQNTYGRLPQDVPVNLKIQSAYRFDFGLTLGADLQVASGRPTDKVIGFPANEQEAGQAIFLVPRGSAGRLPTWYSLDLHAQYTWKLWALNWSFIADIFNVTNEQKPLSIYETFYQQPSTWEQYKSGALVPDLNYGQPTSRQAPRSVRLGFKVAW